MVFLRSIGLFALLSLGTASAAVVWNNGTPVADVNNQNGSIMSDTNQADDFQLLVTTDLTAIRFWSTEFTAADRLPLIFWQILSDAPGTPGSVIASGSAAPTITAAGTNAGSPQFQNDFNISVLGLAAGTYRIRRADIPSGFKLSVPSSGFYDITLSAGQSVTGKNIGAVPV